MNRPRQSQRSDVTSDRVRFSVMNTRRFQTGTSATCLLGVSVASWIAGACGAADAVKHTMVSYASAGEGGGGQSAAGTHPVDSGGAAAGEAGSTTASSGAGEAGDGALVPAGGTAGIGGAVDDAAGAGGAGKEPSCFGDPCSCVQQIQGSAVVRSDGRLLIVQNGAQIPVSNAATGEPLDQVISAWPGQYRGCAVRQDGSVWCWANQADGNLQGLLGTGTGMASVTPYAAYQVQIDPGADPGPTYLRDVRAFHDGAAGLNGPLCAVTHGGELFCWGLTKSLNGDLAQTGSPNEPYARQIKSQKDVAVSDAVELAAGYRHACYTNVDGEVLCWGMNIGGPLGSGSEDSATYPVKAGTLTGVSKLVAGSDYTCALVGTGTEAGRVYCWGSNFGGELGIGPPADNTDAGCLCKRAPMRVRTGPAAYLTDVVDLVAGDQTSCALTSDSSMWCWGAGSGNYAVRLEAPAGVSLPDVGLVTIQSNEPRLLFTDGTYASIRVNQERTSITINCAPLE